MGNTLQNVTCCSIHYMIWNIWSNLWKIFALIRRYIGSLIWCVVIQDKKKKKASKGRFLNSMVLLIQMYPVLERWCISKTVSNQVEVSPWSVAKCPDWLCYGAMLYCVCKIQLCLCWQILSAQWQQTFVWKGWVFLENSLHYQPAAKNSTFEQPGTGKIPINIFAR